MGRLGTVKLNKLIKFIEAYGYCKIRQRGSHATYAKEGKDSITIAVGQKDARDYTVLDIRKALKLTSEELEKKLKEF
jgi:predicted RNA binding protein YcfA (HicA-like mRNA interferase family)